MVKKYINFIKFSFPLLKLLSATLFIRFPEKHIFERKLTFKAIII